MNYGGVFGLFPSYWWGVCLVIIWLWLVREWRKMEGWMWAGMGLVVAGGLANIIDRMVYGGVRDFIYYPVIGVYGNVADVMLVIGGGVMFVSVVRNRNEY